MFELLRTQFLVWHIANNIHKVETSHLGIFMTIV